MALLTTYDVSTNKEDLTDIITNISPIDTPLLTMLSEGKAINTAHHTQKDSLADAAENAQVDGAPFGADAQGMPDKVLTYTQIFAKYPYVSDTQIAVQTHGMKNAYNYQVTKKLKEIARDIERALVVSVGQAGDAGTPRKLDGCMHSIATHSTDNTDSTALTELGYNTALQAVWAGGGNPDVTLVNGTLKRTISGFTGGATKNVEATSKKLVASVDVYDSDFGLQRITAERYINPDDVAILEKDLWAVAWLRKTKHTPLAKDGDRTRGQIIAECTLEARNEAGNGKIINCALA